MADGDDSEVFRVEVAEHDAVAVARSLAHACRCDVARVVAEPALAAAAAEQLAKEHAFGVMLRTERAVPVDLPPFVLRAEVDAVALLFQDARGSVSLMAHGPDHVELHLSGFYGTPREQSDALYRVRVALCERENALTSTAPPPSHPLVCTCLPLRPGSFARLATAPELAAGFGSYLLYVKTRRDHGAALARAFTGLRAFRDYVLSLPAEGDALEAAMATLGSSAIRVEWEGPDEAFVRGGYGYARIETIHLELGDRPHVDVGVRHHRGDLEAVRARLEAYARRPVQRRAGR